MPRALARPILSLLAAACLAPGLATALEVQTQRFEYRAPEERKFGLGISLGSAASVTAQAWTSETQAISFGVGSTQAANTWFYADYLWHVIELAPRASLLPYIGGGLGLGLNRKFDAPASRDRDVFARVPVGFAWYPQAVRLGMFAEVVPTAALATSLSAYLDGAIGARYYF